MTHKHPGEMPTSRIGKRVHFGLPGDVKKRKGGGHGPSGTILDEVWTLDDESPEGVEGWGQYCFFAQHIKWDPAGGRPAYRTIRLGYYRRRAGETWWEFGSQTTVNAGPATIHALLAATLAKTAWYRKGDGS